MTDLLAAVITLEAQAAGELDYFQGRAMHALFLDLTGRAEPGASPGAMRYSSANSCKAGTD